MSGLIGVLDSGVGGLSVLSELINVMPDKKYIYFGDTKNMPYGTKTPEEIHLFTKNILNFFLNHGVKNVVFACNTTSAVAYDNLKKEFLNKLNIFPLIQLAARPAIEGLKDNDTIAVLATKATINSKKYVEEIHKINPKINVLGVDCTGFVEIVENRTYEDTSSIELIKSKLEVVKASGAKRAILGCTHYPYLIDIFKKVLPDIEYFNPAKSLAEYVKSKVEGELSLNNFNSSPNKNIQFFVSKNPEEFKKSAKTFFDIKSEIFLEG